MKAALASAAKKVEAVYSYPYQNHATMEPMNATARYTADKCEVWCSTQNGSDTVRATAASPAWAISMAPRMAALAEGCSHR